MNFETIDRTDHNRIAEQFAARLVEQSETIVPEVAAPAPKKTRRSTHLKTVEPATLEAGTSAEALAPVAPAVLPGMQIVECEQNSREWQLARMGIPTASCFADILAKGEGKTRRTYMLKLAGEILTGEPMENVTTQAMERGHLLEAEARDLYALETGAAIERTGFIRNGRVGCSPDSLVGENGGLEIKTKAPHLLIDLILKGEVPSEHKAQIQGTLWITGRKWWDFMAYWPGIPPFIKRVERDEAYIAELATAVDRFNTDLDAVVAQMRARVEPGFVAAAA